MSIKSDFRRDHFETCNMWAKRKGLSVVVKILLFDKFSFRCVGLPSFWVGFYGHSGSFYLFWVKQFMKISREKQKISERNNVIRFIHKQKCYKFLKTYFYDQQSKMYCGFTYNANQIKSNQIKSILLVQNQVIGLSPVTYSTQIQIQSCREQYTMQAVGQNPIIWSTSTFDDAMYHFVFYSDDVAESQRGS